MFFSFAYIQHNVAQASTIYWNYSCYFVFFFFFILGTSFLRTQDQCGQSVSTGCIIGVCFGLLVLLMKTLSLNF